jgi:hypothetical protein
MTRIIKLLFKAIPIAMCCLASVFGQGVTNSSPSTNAIQAEMEAAIHAVEKIVNQPATAYRRTSGMHVGKFEGGWFHPGAIKPDFNNVDVRKTQETSGYDKYEYVTSDLNPGVVWAAKQLEFNSMTKYFYTNRNVPKKRLTDAEMQEINRLYRIIGKCEHELRPAQDLKAELRAAQAESGTGTNDSSETDSAPAKRPRLLNPYIGGGAIALLVLLLGLNFLRKR